MSRFINTKLELDSDLDSGLDSDLDLDLREYPNSE